jgi:hypothetical protein
MQEEQQDEESKFTKKSIIDNKSDSSKQKWPVT